MPNDDDHCFSLSVCVYVCICVFVRNGGYHRHSVEMTHHEMIAETTWTDAK